MPLLTPGASRFKPLGLLKTGRYSCVSLVLELATQQKRVARWFDQPPSTTEVALLESIDREAKALKTLPSTNVPRFDKVVEGDGGTWMLFEWVEGTPLAHYLAVEETVPEAWIVWWLYQMLATLQALHNHTPAVVIGYLDPSDLLVVEDRVLIADVGILEDMFPEVGASLLNKHPFINFIAPEKRMSVQTTPSGDLFSAAALAFWLGTGHAPVVSGPRAQALHLEALQRLRPQLPPEVSQLVAQMMDFYPSQRPATAQEALDRLGPFVTDLRGQRPPAAPDLEKYKFVAEATRPMISIDKPPTPIFDDTVSQEEEKAVEVAPAVSEDEAVSTALASPSLPPWQEALEDLLWQIRAHPLATFLIVVGVVLVLLVGARAVMSPSGPTTTPKAALMTVVSGHVASRVDPSVAKYEGEWLPVTDIPIGSMLTIGSAGASIRFDHSTLLLEGNSAFTAEERDHGTVAIRFTRGQVRVQTNSGDRLIIRLAGGTITVDPNTDLTAHVSDGPCNIMCQSGSATVSGGGSAHPLNAGGSYNL